MENVCFSGSALAIVSGLLATLSGVIVVLFKALLAAKDERIAELSRLAFRGTDVMEKVADVPRRPR